MPNRTFLMALGLAALMSGCSDPGPAQRAALSTAAVQSELVLLTTLAEGSGPAEVRLRHGQEEAAAGGPSAVFLGADGTLAVADTLAGRILRIRPDGTALAPVEMPWVEDVALDDAGQLYALSRARRQVAAFDRRGQRIDERGLPETMRWVGGVTVLPGGGAALRTAYQESVPLTAEDLHRGLAEGVVGGDERRYRTVRRDGAARVEVVELIHDPEPRWTATASFPVAVTDGPGSLVLVGVTEDSEIIVDVQDVVRDSPVEVTRTVRRYGPSGDLRGEVRLPRGSYAPAHAVSLATNGTVLVLRPTEDSVEVWSWARGGAR